jgi:hypothetical protein
MVRTGVRTDEAGRPTPGDHPRSEDEQVIPDQPRVAIEPQPVMGVVRQGFRLYMQNAGALWQILVPLALVAQVVAVALTISSVPAGSFVSNGTIYVPQGTSLSTIATAHVIAVVFDALIGVITVGATVRLLATTVLGRPEGVGQALTFAFRRSGSLLWLSILVSVLVGVGTVLLIVPGLYALIAFAAAIPVLVVEDVRGIAALQRSRGLIKGRWWATLGALLPATLFTIALAVGLTLALRVSGSVATYALAQGASGLIIQVFITPLAIATLVAIYIDLRARKEPHHAGAALHADPVAPPPGPLGDPLF